MEARRTRSFSVLAAALVASLSLVGCASGSGGGASAPSDTPKAGGSITVGGLVAGGLDPGQPGFSSQSLPFAQPIFSGLFQPPAKPGGDFRPGLADSYKYSADDLSLTIHLRSGLRFQDDTPLDAAAVVWNLNRHIQNSTREKQFFAYVTSITATDASTVTVAFSQPQALLLDALANSSSGFMASRTAFEKMGANAFSAAPVGAGPFKVVSQDPGQDLVLAKADTFWDAKHVYLNGMTYLNTGADAQAALVKLQSDAVQSITWAGTYTSPAVLKAASDDPRLTLQSGPNTRVQVLAINTFSSPFSDLRARQAVSYCMDREAIAKSISQGYATPAYVLSGTDSAVLKSWQDGKKLNPYPHDVKKGTALVKDLGGLSFTLVTNVSSVVMNALQQQWAECGIDAKISITPDYLAQVQNGSYQMAFTVNVNASTNPAASTNYLDPNSANNRFGWRDPAISALVEQAKGVTDVSKAAPLWQQIWSGLTKDGVIIPVISAPWYVASSTNLHDVINRGFGDYTHAWLSS